MKQPVDITMVQQEDGVERSHGGRAHVPKAANICSAANVVLFDESVHRPHMREINFLRGRCCEFAPGSGSPSPCRPVRP